MSGRATSRFSRAGRGVPTTVSSGASADTALGEPILTASFRHAKPTIRSCLPLRPRWVCRSPSEDGVPPLATPHTRVTLSPSMSGKSSSCVTKAMSCANAVAAIQESLTGMRRPESRSSTRRRPHSAATASSTGMGLSSSAAVRVARRRSRVWIVLATRTPARSSPIVMIETAISSGSASTSNRRPLSRAMNTDVSATPRLTRAADRRSSRRPDRRDQQPGSNRPDWPGSSRRTRLGAPTVAGGRPGPRRLRADRRL